MLNKEQAEKILEYVESLLISNKKTREQISTPKEFVTFIHDLTALIAEEINNLDFKTGCTVLCALIDNLFSLMAEGYGDISFMKDAFADMVKRNFNCKLVEIE